MERAEKATENRILGAEAQARRDPEWHELGLEQKVERLRLAFLEIAEQANRAGKVAHAAYSIARDHEHHPQRGLMRPLNSEYALLGGDAGWHEGSLKRARRLLG